jgi:predicted O-methyltransferase YrrM
MVPPTDLADGALAAATGAAFARWLPRAAFAGLELANEPDIALFRGNESGYEATLAVWLAALEAAGVARAVDAPVLAGTSWWPAAPRFLAAFAPRLRAYVQHVASDPRVEHQLLPFRDGVMVARKR